MSVNVLRLLRTRAVITVPNSNSYECKCTQVVEDKSSDNSA